MLTLTAPQVIVVSDPWATVAQFAGIVVASLISIWAVRSQARREELARTRMLYAEYQAIVNSMSERIGEALEMAASGEFSEVGVARWLHKELDPQISEVKAKGDALALHVDFEDSEAIFALRQAFTGAQEHLIRMIKEHEPGIPSFARMLRVIDTNSGHLSNKYGNKKGSPRHPPLSTKLRWMVTGIPDRIRHSRWMRRFRQNRDMRGSSTDSST